MTATAETIAAWMFEELKRDGYLDQEDVVYQIFKKFGKEWDYSNEAGNDVVHPAILTEFRKLYKPLGGEYLRGERRWELNTK